MVVDDRVRVAGERYSQNDWCDREGRCGETLSAEHEIGLLRFLKPPVRARLRGKFEENGLEALRDCLRSLDLWHANDFDDRYRFPLPHPYTRENAHELLIRAGAPPRCWMMMISDREQFDNPNIDLVEAIDLAFPGTRAAILSCIPGELAYIDGDYDRYVFKRHPVS